jgi:hypothetical protein
MRFFQPTGCSRLMPLLSQPSVPRFAARRPWRRLDMNGAGAQRCPSSGVRPVALSGAANSAKFRSTETLRTQRLGGCWPAKRRKMH